MPYVALVVNTENGSVIERVVSDKEGEIAVKAGKLLNAYDVSNGLEIRVGYIHGRVVA